MRDIGLVSKQFTSLRGAKQSAFHWMISFDSSETMSTSNNDDHVRACLPWRHKMVTTYRVKLGKISTFFVRSSSDKKKGSNRIGDSSDWCGHVLDTKPKSCLAHKKSCNHILVEGIRMGLEEHVPDFVTLRRFILSPVGVLILWTSFSTGLSYANARVVPILCLASLFRSTNQKSACGRNKWHHRKESHRLHFG